MGKYLRISAYIRKPFLIYDFASNCSTLNFLIYEEKLTFFFISVDSVLLNPRGDMASIYLNDFPLSENEQG